jgi:hypothetical protein
MLKIGHPVCSAIHKQHIVQLVLQWVTMWESWILNSIPSFLWVSGPVLVEGLLVLVMVQFEGVGVEQLPLGRYQSQITTPTAGMSLPTV